MVVAPESLSSLSAQELREIVTGLMERITEHDRQITQRDAQIGQLDETIASKDREIKYRQAKIDQLTHEMAVLKRWKFGRSREQLDSAQASLLDEAIDADIAAIELELEHLAPVPPADAVPAPDILPSAPEAWCCCCSWEHACRGFVAFLGGVSYYYIFPVSFLGIII